MKEDSKVHTDNLLLKLMIHEFIGHLVEEKITALRKKSKVEVSLEPYMKMAEAFMTFEKECIKSVEMLLAMQKVKAHSDIVLYMSFFKGEKFLEHGECLIGLYKILGDWKREFRFNEAEVFNFTLA